MKYWIIIEPWNLMESFITESISPFNFYERRAFGNYLKREISKEGESYTDLILYKTEPEADYAIEIDDSLVDKSLLRETNKKRQKKLQYWYYPKTIYYQKNGVRFRFKSEEILNSFVAESRIIIEVKTIEKYSTAFYVQKESTTQKYFIDDGSILSFDINRYIEFDNLYNSIKGGVVAFACGICSKASEEEQTVVISLNNLKNSVAGLNADIMISENSLPDFTPCRNLYESVKRNLGRNDMHTQTFDVLKDILDDIIKISTLRYKELRYRNTKEFKSEQEQIERKCKYKIKEIENAYNINEYREELRKIKALEESNGEKENKKRKYFPKDSIEYKRKKELKILIDDFEKGNPEYIKLCKKLKEIQAHTEDVNSKYDATISSLFVRFSDNINIVIKNAKKGTGNRVQRLDFSGIKLHNNIFHIYVDGVDEAENTYFNLLINYLIANPNGRQSNISDSTILKIIEDTGKSFKTVDSSSTEVGAMILASLRELWRYKSNKTDSFSIPEEAKLLQAIMSFFIKPRGFEQIERYMLNKSYQLKEYAFLLCGILMGYAAIPKTFTEALYNNDYIEQEAEVEKFLSVLRNKLTKSPNQ